jgi:hypothetical protein
MNWDVSDIVGGPHPGTLMPIPEDDNTVSWEDPDPFDTFPGQGNMPDANTFDHPMGGVHAQIHQLNNWPTVGGLGAAPTQDQGLAELDHRQDCSGRPKTPIKRRISFGRKSIENLRKKGRNTSPHSEGDELRVPPLPCSYPPSSQSQMDFELPLRSHVNMNPPAHLNPSTTFFFDEHAGQS